MMSQKEQAKKLQEELKLTNAQKVELSVIDKEKNELIKEKHKIQALVNEQIANQGFLISVPNTEVILYENEDFQLLYCNNAEHPGKISFLWAFKRNIRNVTARTPITAQGYVAKIMPKDEINILLNTFKTYEDAIKNKNRYIADLEKELAPLKYIEHLIVKHKIDTES